MDELLTLGERREVEKQFVHSKIRFRPFDELLDAYLKRQIAKSHKHRLDSPDREKIAMSLPSLWCDACPYLDGCEMKDVMDRACKWQLDYADQILALMEENNG